MDTSVDAATPSVDNVRLAILSIVTAVLMLSFSDAIVKLISADFSLWQFYALRSLLAIPILIVLFKWTMPGGSFMPVAVGWTALRGFLMALMIAFYCAALPHVNLSVAASVLYTMPLFVTLFSALFTGDRVGMKSWLAVGIGFVGVLVIVRPAADDFNGYALLPLLSAIMFACAMILTRTKCRKEDPKVIAFTQNLMFFLLGIVVSGALVLWGPPQWAVTNPFLFGDWQPLGIAQWLMFVGLAAIVTAGNIGGAFAYQHGPPTIIATFDYTYLGFSLLWGFLLFTEKPDMQSIIGMALIAAAGILTTSSRAAEQ